jgi:hypothetical protein
MGINAAKREMSSALGKLVACLDGRDGQKIRR